MFTLNVEIPQKYMALVLEVRVASHHIVAIYFVLAVFSSLRWLSIVFAQGFSKTVGLAIPHDDQAVYSFWPLMW